VNVHKTVPKPESRQQDNAAPQEETSDNVSQNPDLQRAKDLIELHNDINKKGHNGQGGYLEEELRQARQDVSRVLKELEEAETR
jgi:hypothetical protein